MACPALVIGGGAIGSIGGETIGAGVASGLGLQ